MKVPPPFSEPARVSPLRNTKTKTETMKLTPFITGSLLALLTAHVAEAAVTYRVYATREGLVGGTTANGHVIVSRDRFCALPSGRTLNAKGAYTYAVSIRNPQNGRVASNVPQWDIGPWNIK